MTAKELYWTPAINNSGQKLYIKPTGTSVWNLVATLAPNIGYYVIQGNDNELYDCKIDSTCIGQINPIESVVIKTFLTSGLTWSLNAVGTNVVKIGWNFGNISNLNFIKIAIYLGSTLIESQIFPVTNNGQYNFTGLTTSTIYTIVYGLIFDSQTFPENPYPVGSLTYLTPTESLTECKRLSNILTY